MRWWRVVRCANPAPLGHRGGHAREQRVVPSALDAARRARVEDARRRSTTWCARAPQRGTSRRDSYVLLTWQESLPLSNTRNQ
jgi:hypothetical protein